MEESHKLVERAQHGDESAMEVLIARYLPGLLAYVRLRAGPLVKAKESASDIVQSVAREVIENFDRFQYRGEPGFKRWLYATALRKLCDRDKYYRAHKRDAAREQPGELDEAILLQQYRSFYTPSRQASAREELQRVEQAFEQLPESMQEVIVLAKIVGLSRGEIATQLGKTDVAVRAMLARALSRLSEMLDEE